MGNDCCSNRPRDAPAHSSRSPHLRPAKPPTAQPPETPSDVPVLGETETSGLVATEPQNEKSTESAEENELRRLMLDFLDLRRAIKAEVEREGDRESVERWRKGDVQSYVQALESCAVEIPRTEELFQRTAFSPSNEQLLSAVSDLQQSFPDPNWLSILHSLLSKSALIDAWEAILSTYHSRRCKLHSKLTDVSADRGTGSPQSSHDQRLSAIDMEISTIEEETTELLGKLLRIVKLAREIIPGYVRIMQAEDRLRQKAEGELTEDIAIRPKRHTGVASEPPCDYSAVYSDFLSQSQSRPGVLFSMLASPAVQIHVSAELADVLLTLELIFQRHSKCVSEEFIEYTVLLHFLEHFPTSQVMEKTLLFLKGLEDGRSLPYLALACDVMNLYKPPYEGGKQRAKLAAERFVYAREAIIRPSDPRKWGATGGILPVKEFFALVTSDASVDFQAKVLLIALCKPENVTQVAYSRLIVLFAFLHAQTESYAISKQHFISPSHKLTPAELEVSMRTRKPQLFLSTPHLLELLTSFLDENSSTLTRKNFTKALDLSWFTSESSKLSLPVHSYLRACLSSLISVN